MTKIRNIKIFENRHSFTGILDFNSVTFHYFRNFPALFSAPSSLKDTSTHSFAVKSCRGHHVHNFLAYRSSPGGACPQIAWTNRAAQFSRLPSVSEKIWGFWRPRKKKISRSVFIAAFPSCFSLSCKQPTSRPPPSTTSLNIRQDGFRKPPGDLQRHHAGH